LSGFEVGRRHLSGGDGLFFPANFNAGMWRNTTQDRLECGVRIVDAVNRMLVLVDFTIGVGDAFEGERPGADDAVDAGLLYLGVDDAVEENFRLLLAEREVVGNLELMLPPAVLVLAEGVDAQRRIDEISKQRNAEDPHHYVRQPEPAVGRNVCHVEPADAVEVAADPGLEGVHRQNPGRVPEVDRHETLVGAAKNEIVHLESPSWTVISA